jgi:phosphoenolpyruvate-protein phosphotransferase
VSRVFRGATGAPGLAQGPIALLRAASQEAQLPTTKPDPQQFAVAQQRVVTQLQRLSGELRAEGNEAEAAIFDAQALMAADPSLAVEVERLVTQDRVSLDAAIARATDAMAATLSALDDPYLRERAADVRAVGSQLVEVVRGGSGEIDVPAGAIVVAAELTPAQTATLRKRSIAGFATAGGTPTGHVAILARALSLPAVVGLGDAVLELADRTNAIMRADEGQLIAEPDQDEIAAFEAEQQQRQHADERRRALIGVPAQTRDGQRVQLWANIGHPDEAAEALAQGAEGVGLFRTEFLFLDRDTPPSEDEQERAYRAAVHAMAGRPVIIRTIDIGGDKPIPYLSVPNEANPFLGHRGVRFGMRFPDLFQTQLRALLRAATAGDLRIMLPMVATPEDVQWAREQIAIAATALREADQPHKPDPPLGIMIETPAAALTLDRLADGIAFCSIGSNDLTQYTLAADRTDQELGQRYIHTDPAVWRLLATAARDAERLGLEISLCGELAADPQASIALVGVGVQKLSMSAPAIPLVKEALAGVTLAEAQRRGRDAQGGGRRRGRR